MNPSKQFRPRRSSTSKHTNAKVWGNQSQRKVDSFDRGNTESKAGGFKSFNNSRSIVSKIFAPKLTVLNNDVIIGSNKQVEEQADFGKLNLGDLENDLSTSQKSKKTTESKTNLPKITTKNIQSKSKVASLIEAILPKISFGKTPSQASQPIESDYIVESKIETTTVDQDRYSPEQIFQKIKSTQKNQPSANLFSHIKNSSIKAHSNWWDSIKFDYYDKVWFRKLNYQLVAFDVAKNFNRLVVGLIVLSLIGFFSYLSFFDQFFTIKKYNIEFANQNYLNKQQTSELVTHFQKNKLFRVFPNNQYWFANNLSLTASAKEIFPDVTNVNVQARQWPDQISLQIETNKPILTLWVTENNELKYWRVNENGKILSQDKAAIWYNLVKIEKPYSIQNPSTQQLSLFNHSFENDPLQKQRFVTTKAILDYFKSINIQANSTSFPSISDTDIIVESSTGTKFLFDSQAFDAKTQIQRLDFLLKSQSDKTDFYAQHAKGDFAYFDFRVAQKVHTCKVAAKCNIKPE